MMTNLRRIGTRPREAFALVENLARLFSGRGQEFGLVLGFGNSGEFLARVVARYLAYADRLSDDQLACCYTESSRKQLAKDFRTLVRKRKVLVVAEHLGRQTREELGELLQILKQSGATGVEIGVLEYDKEVGHARFGEELVRIKRPETGA